nr:hypothetical protein [Actinomycetota bacterium]
SQDRVVEVIGDLIQRDLATIDELEKRSEDKPEEREITRRWLRNSEEGIFIRMKVAEELGVLEDINRKIPIPFPLRREYWGGDHPTETR